MAQACRAGHQRARGHETSFRRTTAAFRFINQTTSGIAHMKILVWGLGYVGTVTAACLAEMGHRVIGVELNAEKAGLVNEGKSPIIEKGLGELLAAGVAGGRLRATTDVGPHFAGADISMVCVGTPSAANGDTDLRHLRQVMKEIGLLLKTASNRHVVVVRSTVFPHHLDQVVLPVLEEHSGGKAGTDFGLAFNPEFLREANAVEDFYHPPYTVIGEYDAASGDVLEELYGDLDAPVFRVPMGEAALLKLANNAFHAMKIAFANEIGRISSRLKLNGSRVMDLVCRDTKLNISDAYLKPGFAFGGSCLPKDLRSISRNARRLDVDTRLLDSILPSNGSHIEFVLQKIADLNVRSIAILGMSFKSGTDDLRESPVVELIRLLWQDGYRIKVYDPSVRLDHIMGSNREYLFRQLPQAGEVLTDRIEDAIEGAEAVVMAHRDATFLEAVRRAQNAPVIIDLAAGQVDIDPGLAERYHGIAW
jgi:GDP-mannose 6-dehydrogenase